MVANLQNLSAVWLKHLTFNLKMKKINSIIKKIIFFLFLLIIGLSFYILKVFFENKLIFILDAKISTCTLVTFCYTVVVIINLLYICKFHKTLSIILVACILVEIYIIYLVLYQLEPMQNILYYIPNIGGIIKYYSVNELAGIVAEKCPRASIAQIETVVKNARLPLPEYLQEGINNLNRILYYQKASRIRGWYISITTL